MSTLINIGTRVRFVDEDDDADEVHTIEGVTYNEEGERFYYLHSEDNDAVLLASERALRSVTTQLVYDDD